MVFLWYNYLRNKNTILYNTLEIRTRNDICIRNENTIGGIYGKYGEGKKSE